MIVVTLMGGMVGGIFCGASWWLLGREYERDRDRQRVIHAAVQAIQPLMPKPPAATKAAAPKDWSANPAPAPAPASDDTVTKTNPGASATSRPKAAKAKSKFPIPNPFTVFRKKQ